MTQELASLSRSREQAATALLKSGWSLGEVIEALCPDKFPRMTIRGMTLRKYDKEGILISEEKISPQSKF